MKFWICKVECSDCSMRSMSYEPNGPKDCPHCHGGPCLRPKEVVIDLDAQPSEGSGGSLAGSSSGTMGVAAAKRMYTGRPLESHEKAELRDVHDGETAMRDAAVESVMQEPGLDELAEDRLLTAVEEATVGRRFAAGENGDPLVWAGDQDDLLLASVEGQAVPRQSLIDRDPLGWPAEEQAAALGDVEASAVPYQSATDFAPAGWIAEQHEDLTSAIEDSALDTPDDVMRERPGEAAYLQRLLDEQQGFSDPCGL